MRTIPGRPGCLTPETRLLQTLLAGLSRVSFLPSLRAYNLTVSHERKLLWFRVAKVGTRTILNHFRSHGVRLDVEHASFIHYSPRLYAGYFKFAFVRNPWDRLVSCHADKVVRGGGKLFGFGETERREMMRFENFVDYVARLNLKTCDRHLRLQTELIDLNNIDYLGRIESFAEAFGQICAHVGIEGDVPISKNVSQHMPHPEYCTDSVREKVARLYRQDIQILGYRFM